MYMLINCDKSYEEKVQGVRTRGHNFRWCFHWDM